MATCSPGAEMICAGSACCCSDTVNRIPWCHTLSTPRSPPSPSTQNWQGIFSLLKNKYICTSIPDII
jgi:hypothetical protein